MNPWKEVLVKLSKAGNFLARWHLQSGVEFYMYIPREMDMGSDVVRPGSGVRYEEILSLEIMGFLSLGGLNAANDINACRQALASIHEVSYREIEGGIELSLLGTEVR